MCGKKWACHRLLHTPIFHPSNAQSSLYPVRLWRRHRATRRRNRNQPDLVPMAIFAYAIPDLREVELLLGVVELAGVPVLEGGGHKLGGAAASLVRD